MCTQQDEEKNRFILARVAVRPLRIICWHAELSVRISALTEALNAAVTGLFLKCIKCEQIGLY